jgi:methyl-accepting chemotaxis protein
MIMRLSTKLYAAFAAVLAVAACVGGFLLVQINAVSGLFVDYRSTARATLAFEEAARNVADLRSAALRYRLSRREDDARLVRQESGEVRAAVAQAKTRTATASTHQALDGVLSNLDGYVAAFDALAAALREGQAPRAEEAGRAMDRLGPEMGRVLGGLAHGYVQRQNELGPRAQGMVDSANLWGVVLLALGLLAGAAISVVMARRLSRAIVDMTATMKTLADGRTDVAVPGVGRKDEIGAMAAAVEVFKTNAVEKARLEAQAEADKARAEADKKAAMRALADGFQTSVDGVVQSLSAASSQMLAVAKAMSGSAQRASERATAVAAASEEATVNVQTVASASEEMSQSLAEVSGRVSQSAEMTSRAASEAVDATGKVGKLAESAATIGEVIKLISAIAEQTNLLALNATIEAARAGEAGRGFAVVASEVKNLANQTAKATEEIAAQITRMQEDTSGVVGAIDSIGKKIDSLNQGAASIAAAVEQQHAATQEIARNTTQAAEGTRQVSTNISDVSAAVGETGAAADQVLTAAQSLSAQADLLRGEVKGFVERVRAA